MIVRLFIMNKKYCLPLFLLIQIIVLQILQFFPDFVERSYSNGLYQYWSKFARIVFSKIPFSVGDCLYAVLIIWIIIWFWKVRRTWKQQWKIHFLSILSAISVFYFLFHLLWAFNYYRQPLFEKMNIKREYSDADLLNFTQKLILKTNEIQYQITTDASKKVIFNFDKKTAYKMSLNGYEKLAAKYPYFKYEHLNVKNSLFSMPLSYMGFGGYLNPFTNEAQVNDLMPIYNFPITSCHEMAHQMGFGSESECNFIGFLAATKNENLYFKYSGYSFALRYCLVNWETRNPAVLKELLAKMNPGILENYKENKVFWNSYQTPIEKGFEVFYDRFLKLNQQADGMEGYSKFVNLLVNFYPEGKSFDN